MVATLPKIHVPTAPHATVRAAVYIDEAKWSVHQARLALAAIKEPNAATLRELDDIQWVLTDLHQQLAGGDAA